MAWRRSHASYESWLSDDWRESVVLERGTRWRLSPSTRWPDLRRRHREVGLLSLADPCRGPGLPIRFRERRPRNGVPLPARRKSRHREFGFAAGGWREARFPRWK